jgi:C1A family cysteine protease
MRKDMYYFYRSKISLFLLVLILIGSALSTIFSSTSYREDMLDTALDSEINQKTHIKSMANPAAIYCRELGYDYQIEDEENGQFGQCVLPDAVCDGWDFLNGKCGQAHNACAQQGLDTIVMKDGKNAYSREYTLCVSEDGKTSTPATTLFRMSEKIANSRCEQGDQEKFNQTLTAEETELIEPILSQPKITFNLADFAVFFPFIGKSSPSFDWRNYNGSNWLTPVRDQGSCGGCWAFSATGVAEAALNIANNNPDLDKDLSEQYLISDCDVVSGSCCGGYESDGLEFIRDQGVPDEGCMPYTDGYGCSCDYGCECAYNDGGDICSNTTCNQRCGDWSSRLSRITQVNYQFSTDREVIKQKLREYGPLAAAIGMENDNQFDANGIYRCQHGEHINHAIVIVGYNDIEGYWIIRNSWGSTWNGDGYFKLGYGECHIEEEVTYASAK